MKKVCIGQFVKSHFLQKKNHNFFVKQFMKIIVILLNQEHFGQHIMKKKVSKYVQLDSVISSLADRSISLIHPV